MSMFLKRVFKATAITYGLSLPLAFIVGGAYFSRPIRTPVGARALAEGVDPEWDTNFLRGSREIKITIGPKVRLAANVFGADANTCVILLHPSGGNRMDCLSIAYRLWRENIGVVMLDRRAHGSSEGDSQPLFLGEAADMSAVIDWLVSEAEVGTSAIGILGVGDAGITALVAAGKDPRIDAAAAIEPAASASDYVSRVLARWSGIPRPLLIPQSVIAVRAMALFSSLDSQLLEPRADLAAVGCPVFLASDNDANSKDDVRTVYTALHGAKVELQEGAPRDEDYDKLASFFKRSL